MKYNEARDVFSMLKAATAKHSVDAATTEYWELQMQALDADIATKAVLSGAKNWRFFPSWAEFYEIYNFECKKAKPTNTWAASEDFLPPGVAEPSWVKCWRESRMWKDTRLFVEQIPAIAEALLDDPYNQPVPGESFSDETVWVQPGEYGYAGCRYDFIAPPDSNRLCVWHPEIDTAQPLKRTLIGGDLGGIAVMMCMDCRERYLKRREEALVVGFA